MTEGLLYFLILAVILVPVTIIITGNIYRKSIISVKTVHAGKGGTHAFLDDTSAIRISPFEVFYYNGKKINPKDYEIRTAVGNCMAARGIMNGDILFIQKFKEGINKEIVKGDILFIKKEKNGYPFYKIREFERFDNDNNAVTFYYVDKNGSTEYSSSFHPVNDIEGIVKIRFEYKR